MKRSLPFLLVLFLAMTGSLIAQDQNAKKAKIYIKKSQNGEITEMEKEIPITDGKDLEDLLNELGVWEDFENLREGETIELDVRRFDEGDWQSALELAFTGEQAPRPFLGVVIENLDEREVGVKVSEIVEGSAASESELEPGDIIVSIEKEDIRDVQGLIQKIDQYEVGEKVVVEYERQGKKKKTRITLGEKANEYFPHAPNLKYFDLRSPDMDLEIPEMEEFELLRIDPENEMFWKDCESQKAFLGVTPSLENSDKGVMIGAVVENSSAEKIGIKDGDIITEINAQSVSTFDELAELIGNMKSGEKIEITVNRDGKEFNLSGELGSRNFGKQENFHFFKEFKGMDEEGDLIFDFEIDMDETDMQEREKAIKKLLEEQEAMLMEIEQNFQAQMEEINVTIEIDNISEEEASRVNKTADTPLKTENDLEMSTINFFPNPSTGEFNLRFDLPNEGDLRVMVYNQNGGVVYNEEIDQFQGTYSNVLDLGIYSDGIYFLQVIQNGKTYSKKLIKG